MAEQKTFKCPNCGASLSTDGRVPTVRCPYCGSTVPVPPELRVHPEPEPAVAGPAPSSPPADVPVRASRRGRSAGCGGTVAILLILLGIAAAVSLFRGGNNPLESIPFVSTATPTVEKISRPLEGTLPRQAHYASLQYTVTKAVISNLVPGTAGASARYQPDRAYAYVDVTVHNPIDTGNQVVLANLLQLQLADGKMYRESSGWAKNVYAQTSFDIAAYFPVPADATWPGAKLIFSLPGKEPLTLPLDGPVPPAIYPIELAAGAEATAQRAAYKVLLAELDLDSAGVRADAGKQFLILQMRVTNNSTSAGGMALSPNSFRLLIDGVPSAPTKAPIELIYPSSAFEGEVVFVIPATATAAELQVGEVGRGETAKIALALSAN